MPDSGERADAQGYITDVPYTIKFYARQSPGQVVTAAQHAGVAAPSLEAPFTYADFGCGRGMTLLVLASCFPESRFFGIDVNAEHVEEAQARADRAGLKNLRFLARSFASIGEGDLPPLDLATAHGVYSWVGESVREELRGVITRHLTPQGLAMISYNTRAGYASMDPLQKLLMGLSEVAPGDAVEKRRAAIRLVRRMRETKQVYFERYPSADQRVERWPKHDETYLFHEYFNAYWHPLSFAEVAAEMRSAGLHFCGDPLYRGWVSGKGRQAPEAWLTDPTMMEEMASVASAQAFRYDVFTKSAEMDLTRPPRIPEEMLFGLSQPPQSGEVAKAMQSTSMSGRLLGLLVEGPKRFGAIRSDPLFAKSSPEGAALILRAAMAQGLVADYRQAAGGGPSSGNAVATALGRELVQDPDLAKHMLPVPAPRIGSAVMLPPLMVAVLFALDGGEAGLVERVAGRVHELTGTDRDGRKKESYDSILKRAEDAVGRFQRQWLPFLKTCGAVA